jgi:hypothetical protein
MEDYEEDMGQFNSVHHRNCRGTLYEDLGYAVQLMEEGCYFNVEQIAWFSNEVRCDRLRRFSQEHDWAHLSNCGTYPTWLKHVSTNLDNGLCDKYGHKGIDYGDAEHGSFSFDCVMCNFNMNGYM